MIPIEMAISNDFIMTCMFVLIVVAIIAAVIMYSQFDPAGTIFFVMISMFSVCLVVAMILFGILPGNEYIPNLIIWKITGASP